MNNIKDQLYNKIDLYNNINSDNTEIKNEFIEETKEILNINSNNKLYEMTIIYNIDKNKDKIRLIYFDYLFYNIYDFNILYINDIIFNYKKILLNIIKIIALY